MDNGQSWVDQLLRAWEAGPGTGVDPTLIAAQLALTPTQRLQRLQDFINSIEDATRHARRLSPAPADVQPASR